MKIAKLLPVSAIGLACLVIGDVAQAGTIRQLDFENAQVQKTGGKWHSAMLKDNGSEHFISELNGRGEMPAISNKFARKGRFALRASKKWGRAKKHRSEAFLIAPNEWRNGKRFIGLSIFVPKHSGRYDDWTIPLQAQMGYSNPIFALSMVKGTGDGNTFKMEAVHRWGKGNKDRNPGQLKKPLGTFAKGRWHDIVVELRPSPNGGGTAKVYAKQGGKWSVVSNYRGKLGNRWSNPAHNDVEVKYGLYMGGRENKAHEIFFDQVKLAHNLRGAMP